MKIAVLFGLLSAACFAEQFNFAEKHKAKAKDLLKQGVDKPKKPPKEDLLVLSAEDAKKKESKISNQKYTHQELQQIVKEHSTGPMADVGPLENYIDLWYVNLKASHDRKTCMDQQISEMGMKSNRFAAFSFKQCRAAEYDDVVTCLAQKKYGDCVKSGINWGAVQTHGSASNEQLDRMYKIVSNWCSHKRMMRQMYKQWKDKKSKKKYAVMLEDDVAFDRKEFMRKVVNFCEKSYDGNLNKTWTMVQIDPFGSKCDKHIVGYFEGLPVWKPRNVNMGWECSNYWGAQALLIKYDKIPEIIKHMEDHPTVPLDWLPAKLPGGLALRANIALQPEASRSVHMKVPMPAYCQGSVKTSTIGGFRQKTLGRALALAQKSGDNVLDVAKVVVDPADEEYAQLVKTYNAYDPMGNYTQWLDMKEKAEADLAKYGIH